MIDLERTDYEFRRKIKKTTVKIKEASELWIPGSVDGWIYEDSAAVDGGTDPVVEQLWFGTIYFKRKISEKSG